MYRLALCLIFLFSFIPLSWGKVYWLPDFLQDNLDRNAGRVNEPSFNKPENTNKSCADWNMLTLSEITVRGLEKQDCKQENIPDVGVCFFDCSCPSKYQYTTSNCSGDKIPSGLNCDGKYDKCLCDTSQFPYTSCPSGFILGGTSCSDDNIHYSDCIDLCETLIDYDCGNFGCQQYYASCPSKCEICYTDNCHTREDNIGDFGCKKNWDDCSSKCEIPYTDGCHLREDNTTDYGCEKYWQDCSSKCEVGKTCTPTDCSDFPLTAAPANASYETCTPGCGDNTIYYKFSQCNSGFWDLNNFLCNTNQICTWKIN